jgi:hypothetical protein
MPDCDLLLVIEVDVFEEKTESRRLSALLASLEDLPPVFMGSFCAVQHDNAAHLVVGLRWGSRDYSQQFSLAQKALHDAFSAELKMLGTIVNDKHLLR